MSRWPIVPLRGYIEEISRRRGSSPAEVLSVTHDGEFVRSLDVFDKQVFSFDTANYKTVRYNDLAYNPSRINVGSIALCDFEAGGAVSPMYTVVRCREMLLPKYLFYFLRSGVGRQHISHRMLGAVRDQLRFSDLEMVELPLPSTAEQSRIVKLLAEVEALREGRKRADKRLREVIHSLFQQRFCFTDADFTTARTRLEHFGSIITGNTPSRSVSAFYGDYVEWVKTDNIDGVRGVVSQSAESLSEVGARHGRVVPEGSVLVTCIAGGIDRIGDAAITDRPVAINQQISAIVPHDGVESIYLWALLFVLKPFLHASATGVVTQLLTKSALARIPAPLPPLPAQQEFAVAVRSVRSVEAAQIISGGRLDSLAAAASDRAFLGEL